MKLPFTELLSRITGVSTPIFGISWNPPVLDTTIAMNIITFLEDRRPLYSDICSDMPKQTIQSVEEIRNHLTDQLSKVDRSSLLATSLRAMRTACRRFLDRTEFLETFQSTADTSQPFGKDVRESHLRQVRNDIQVYRQALSDLRKDFGGQIAVISVRYGIDVEEELARIIPKSNS